MADAPALHAPNLAAHSIAERLAILAGRTPPPEALALAGRALVDTVGVLLAGRSEPPVAMLSSTLRDGDEALSLATGRRLDAADAALVDGLTAHMLDYDDVAAHGHPSVVIVPALLTEAQRIGASGAALLTAAAIGYEAWSLVAACERDAYHLGSWHPTPVLGVLAATTALAALTRLDPDRTRHALGLAASFAAGVIANFGSPAKPLQAGRAAASAIQAIRLASAGFTSSADAIDGPHGLLRGVSPRGNVEVDAIAPGGWRSLAQGLSVKRYPVCYASHRAIDAVLALAEVERLRPGDVHAITVSLGAAPAATLRYAHPRTGAEARFSMNHNLAAALADRAGGFAQLTDEYVRRADVGALYPLIRMEVGGEDCPEQPGMAKFDRVVVTLADGRTLDSGPIRYPRGHAHLSLSEVELDAKFRDCARHGGIAEPDTLLDRLRAIGECADLREAGPW
jgi:2-methylcitrate dehydratase PrpD